MAQEVLETPKSKDAKDATEEWPVKKKPRALRTLLRQRELISSLVFRDIRARYKQSVLGVAWALLTPVGMTIVYTVVFSHIVKVDTGGIPYPIFSYAALLPWTFFSQAIASGTECLVMNFALITKIYFPREVFPIAATLGKTVDFALGVLVLIPLFFIYHVQISWTVLLVVPLLAIQLAFMLGVSFMVSSVNLFYRDIRHVVPLLLHVWMYLTPIIYPLNLVPNKLIPFYMLNPMAPIIEGYRSVVLQGQQPMWGYLGVAAAISFAMLVIGYRVFKKLEPKFAEAI